LCSVGPSKMPATNNTNRTARPVTIHLRIHPSRLGSVSRDPRLPRRFHLSRNDPQSLYGKPCKAPAQLT
jgi:hypothetical protein